jgi:hypothetical protein
VPLVPPRHAGESRGPDSMARSARGCSRRGLGRRRSGETEAEGSPGCRRGRGPTGTTAPRPRPQARPLPAKNAVHHCVTSAPRFRAATAAVLVSGVGGQIGAGPGEYRALADPKEAKKGTGEGPSFLLTLLPRQAWLSIAGWLESLRRQQSPAFQHFSGGSQRCCSREMDR